MSDIDIDQQLVRRLDGASITEKFGIYARLMGPAWLGIALNVGGATFVTGAVLGASTGVKYLWVVTLAILGSWMMMMGIMKLTLVNKDPLIKTIKDHIHPIAGVAIAFSTLLVNEIFHTTQVFLSAAFLSTLFGGSLELWVIATAVLVSAIILPGRSRGYEKVIEHLMKVVIFLLLLAILTNVFFIPVDWGAVLSGLLVPTVPSTQADILLVTSVIGAGFVITVPVVSSYGWKTRDWDSSFLPFGRWEVHISQVVFLLVNWLIIIVFAFTLNQQGTVPESPIEGALALRPLVGDFAFILFGFGLWAAVISSIMMQIVINGYVVSDLMDWELDPSSRKWKLVALATFIPGIVVPFINVSPFQWVVYGSAFNSSFTFIFLIFLIYLLRSEAVMGEHRITGRLYYGLLYALFVGALVFARFWIGFL